MSYIPFVRLIFSSIEIFSQQCERILLLFRSSDAPHLIALIDFFACKYNMTLPIHGSAALSGSAVSNNANLKMDVDQLIKEYDPEVGLAKFMADHIKIPVRVSKNSVAVAQSPLKRCKNQVSSLKTKHRYFQQPGQCHNRDRCDACLGIGNIICCDTCPASFHLSCFDPPINEENLGKVWHCRECSNSGVTVGSITIGFPFVPIESESIQSKVSSFSPLKTESEDKPADLPCETMYDAIKHGRNRRKRLLETFPIESPSSKKAKSGISQIREVDATLHQILKLLKVHCLKLNPKAFDLPRNYCTYEPLVGSSWYNQRDFELTLERIPRSETKQAICLDSENYVPNTPAISLCYECSKSCANSPLISCDYCQSDYHLECVDPPLTCLPQGRWMCPLHPHFHKRNLLLSSSWSTRVAYHDQFAATVIPEDVKRRFIQNISKQHPPWCVKVESSKMLCEVPQSIKDMYKYPAWRDVSSGNVSHISSRIEITEPKYGGISNGEMNEDCQMIYGGLLKLVIRAHKIQNATSVSQHPSNLVSVRKKNLVSEDSFTHRIEEAFQKLASPQFQRPMCSVAVVFCINTNELIFMTERCLIFGTDVIHSDVVLDSKVCSNVSSKHAILFLDTVSNYFELLNYSQYGTIVDGKRLGVELSHSQKINRYISSVDASSCPTDAIREFMRLSKKVSLRSEMSRLKNIKSNSRSVQCSCDGMFVSGWEGSSAVNHGQSYSMVEEGERIEFVTTEPEKHENLYYIQRIEQLDMDLFQRIVCAFMNSADDGYIWLGLDQKAFCRGMILNRAYRDKIRREFCHTSLECGYRPPYGNVETCPVTRRCEKVPNLFVVKIFLPRITLSINKEKIAYKINGNFWKRNPNGEIYMINHAKRNICPM